MSKTTDNFARFKFRRCWAVLGLSDEVGEIFRFSILTVRNVLNPFETDDTGGVEAIYVGILRRY